MPPLRDLTNEQVVRVFIRMGGHAREGKRHTVVYFRRHKLVFPRGEEVFCVVERDWEPETAERLLDECDQERVRRLALKSGCCSLSM